jgi:hypothetical protein
VTCPSPIAADIAVGAVGKPAGTAVGDVFEATPVPIALIAFAVKVYEVPFVNPVTRQLVAGTNATQVLPLLAVIKYEVIGLPPSSAGGFHETTVEVSPAKTANPVGAPGAAAGIALAETEEKVEAPLAFTAATVNVYEPPFVRPFTVKGDDDAVKVSPVGATETIYPVIGDPSALAPLNVMTALRSPATAVTVVGASGIPDGVTEFDDAIGEFPIVCSAIC